MHPADPGQTLTLTDLVRAWRRRWRILALGVAMGAGAAVAAHELVDERFEAVTVVQVESADPALVDMAAEEAVATSRRVTAEALDALGDRTLTIERLEAATSAHAVDSSRVLRVEHTAATPRAAARGADAVAQAYLAARAVDAAEADAAAERPTGRVVDPARLPLSPAGPSLVVTLLTGSLVGIGLTAPVAAAATRGPAARAS